MQPQWSDTEQYATPAIQILVYLQCQKKSLQGESIPFYNPIYALKFLLRIHILDNRFQG